MDWQFEEDNPLTRGFGHLHIPVDDVEDENLIRWFPQSNAFIDKALKTTSKPVDVPVRDAESASKDDQTSNGNAVFIHW